MCVVDLKESEWYHSTWSPIDRASPGLKTDRDHLMKDNLGCYFPKTLEMAKGKKELWCHRELNHSNCHVSNSNCLEQSSKKERTRGGCRCAS